MKIAIGCDPNAMEQKDILKAYIESLGHEVHDYGSDDPIYANTAIRVAEDVASGLCDRGILLCGTGIGVSIAANKVKAAYAACVTDIYQAQRAQLSNHANIMTMGSQVVGIESMKCLVKEYLGSTWDPACRSVGKVSKILEYEQEQFK